MRKYLGNITTYTDRKTEADPVREELRQQLHLQFRSDRAIKESKGHIEGIFKNPAKIMKSLVDLFDNDGRAPPHIAIEDILGQHRRLRAQLQWLTVIVEELREKMAALDPERYRADLSAWEKFEKEQAEEREKIFLEKASQENQDLYPSLSEAIRGVLQITRRAAEMRKFYKMNIEDICIVEIRQTERALHYLFAEHLSQSSVKSNHPADRYAILKRDADWLAILAADLKGKLIAFGDVVDAVPLYLGGERYVETKD